MTEITHFRLSRAGEDLAVYEPAEDGEGYIVRAPETDSDRRVGTGADECLKTCLKYLFFGVCAEHPGEQGCLFIRCQWDEGRDGPVTSECSISFSSRQELRQSLAMAFPLYLDDLLPLTKEYLDRWREAGTSLSDFSIATHMPNDVWFSPICESTVENLCRYAREGFGLLEEGDELNIDLTFAGSDSASNTIHMSLNDRTALRTFAANSPEHALLVRELFDILAPNSADPDLSDILGSGSRSSLSGPVFLLPAADGEQIQIDSFVGLNEEGQVVQIADEDVDTDMVGIAIETPIARGDGTLAVPVRMEEPLRRGTAVIQDDEPSAIGQQIRNRVEELRNGVRRSLADRQLNYDIDSLGTCMREISFSAAAAAADLRAADSTGASTECALRSVTVRSRSERVEIADGNENNMLFAALDTAACRPEPVLNFKLGNGADFVHLEVSPPEHLDLLDRAAFLDWAAGHDGLDPVASAWIERMQANGGTRLADQIIWPPEADERFVLLKVRAPAGDAGLAFLFDELSPGNYRIAVSYGNPGEDNWSEICLRAERLMDDEGGCAVITTGGTKSIGETARSWLEAVLACEEPNCQVSGGFEPPQWMRPVPLPVPAEVAELLGRLSRVELRNAELAEQVRRLASRVLPTNRVAKGISVRPVARLTALPDATALGVSADDAQIPSQPETPQPEVT